MVAIASCSPWIMPHGSPHRCRSTAPPWCTTVLIAPCMLIHRSRPGLIKELTWVDVGYSPKMVPGSMSFALTLMRCPMMWCLVLCTRHHHVPKLMTRQDNASNLLWKSCSYIRQAFIAIRNGIDRACPFKDVLLTLMPNDVGLGSEGKVLWD